MIIKQSKQTNKMNRYDTGGDLKSGNDIWLEELHTVYHM